MINSKLSDLKDCKDSNDSEKIKSCIEALNAEWSKVSQEMYNAQQNPNPGTASTQEPKADKKDNSQDNVENVDYEVVDDDK